MPCWVIQDLPALLQSRCWLCRIFAWPMSCYNPQRRFGLDRAPSRAKPPCLPTCFAPLQPTLPAAPHPSHTALQEHQGASSNAFLSWRLCAPSLEATNTPHTSCTQRPHFWPIFHASYCIPLIFFSQKTPTLSFSLSMASSTFSQNFAYIDFPLYDFEIAFSSQKIFDMFLI